MLSTKSIFSAANKARNLVFEAVDTNEETTIGKYLNDLLIAILEEEDKFDPSKPFGKTDWKCQLYKVLIENNLVDGEIDEDGQIIEVDGASADAILYEVARIHDFSRLD